MSGSIGTAASVALVGDHPAAAAVAKIVAARRLRLDSFDRVEDLLATPGEWSCAVLRAGGGAPAARPIAELLAAGAGAVLVLCAQLRPHELRAVIRAGAAGVVLEEELAEALGPCLDAALAGQVCVPRLHAGQLQPPALSARENQVLGLLVMGQTNGQIASRLYLAESTVKSHLSSAFDKLGVRSRGEAVDLILDPDSGLGAGILGLGVEQVA